MTIKRAEKNSQNPYTRISNTALQDETLSRKALGVLCYLLSKPDDWDVNVQQLSNHFDCGTEAIRRSLDELEQSGYLVQHQPRDEKNRFTKKVYVIYENGKPGTGQSGNGKAPSTKQRNEKTKEVERTNQDNNKTDDVVDRLRGLGVSDQMSKKMANILNQKESNQQRKEEFLRSLKQDVQNKNKKGGHIVWAIRNK